MRFRLPLLCGALALSSAVAIPTASAAGCGSAATRVVPVSDGPGLRSALLAAAPGDAIVLADGTYTGAFTLTATGRPDAPITICGSRSAVLDGEGTALYVLHLDGASFVQLMGFTVAHGRKGIMLDRSSGSALVGLEVHHIGDEAVHLRAASADNSITGNVIHDTGLTQPQYGEGVYVGSAPNHWASASYGAPDPSSRNTVSGNTFWNTTAEAVDIKEGTVGGVVSGNAFDGAGTTSAASWVDVKGNGWTISGNVGVHAPRDGFHGQTLDTVVGLGNVFTGNTASVDAAGYGFNVPMGDLVRCDNTVTGAGHGYSNRSCT